VEEKFITILFVYKHWFHIVGGVGICTNPSSRRCDNTTDFCWPGGFRSEYVLYSHSVGYDNRSVMHRIRLWFWSRHHTSTDTGTFLPQLSSTSFYSLLLSVAFCRMHRLFLCIQSQIEAHLHCALGASLTFLLLIEVGQLLMSCTHPHLCCYQYWHVVVVVVLPSKSITKVSMNSGGNFLFWVGIEPVTSRMTCRIDGNHRYSSIKNQRSLFLSRIRLWTLRRNPTNWRRSAAFSASSRLFDLNGAAKTASTKHSSVLMVRWR